MSVKNITVDHDNEGRRIDNFLFLILKIYLNQKSTKLLEKEKLELIQKELNLILNFQKMT